MSLESQIECFSGEDLDQPVTLSPEEIRYDSFINAAIDALSTSRLNDLLEARLLLVPELADKMEEVHQATNGNFNSVNVLNDGVNGTRRLVKHRELRTIVTSDTALKAQDFDQPANSFKQAVNAAFVRAFEHLQSGGQDHKTRQRLAEVRRSVREMPSVRPQRTHSRPASSDHNSR